MAGLKGVFVLTRPEKYIGKEVPTWRSLWERRVFVDLENNDSVVRWCSEGIRIPYVSPKDNRVHGYYPDLYVEVKNKDGGIDKLIVEIKPYKETVPPVHTKRKRKKTIIYETVTYNVNISKWKAAKQFCSSKGFKFIIITEKSLNYFK